MITQVRRFNESGVREFTERLESLRGGHTALIDEALLLDPQWSAPTDPNVMIEQHSFTTKKGIAEYLYPAIRPILDAIGEQDPGLWAWLSAFFWDSVCPQAADGKRKVLSPYHYVFGYANEQNSKKHLIAMSVKLYAAAPDCRLLLHTPCYSATKIAESVSTRLSFMRLPGLLQLLDRLYWDEAKGRPKPNVADPRVVHPGDLDSRLPSRIRQLELTYDLTDLNADQLLNLLGDEFKAWANGRSPPRAKSSSRSKPQRQLFEDA